MTMRSSEGREWIEALEYALVPLVGSATAHRFRLPPLTNAEYRDLGAAANKDPGAREVFERYMISLNDNPSEVVELLSRHPAIEPNAEGRRPLSPPWRPTNEQGHPLRMKLTVVEGFRLTEIAAWAQLHLGTGTRVVSDGLACFHGVTAAGCVHESVVVGSGKAAVERPEFRWVNTILGNIKNALRGTYHAIRPRYAQRYLSEFEYRFNRRFDLPDIIPRLVYVALRTPPMPERLLKLRLA